MSTSIPRLQRLTSSHHVRHAGGFKNADAGDGGMNGRSDFIIGNTDSSYTVCGRGRSRHCRRMNYGALMNLVLICKAARDIGGHCGRV